MRDEPQLSVVVPLYNEEENVPLLVDAVRAALAEREDWELVLVDDGSQDGTRDLIRALAAEDPRVRGVLLARNYGQTAAMQAGFNESRGSVVVSMDGDLQNDPRDIPRLLDELAKGFDLVTGYRVRRQDRLVTRKVPSWVANRLIRFTTGVDIRDNGCSLKVYRRELLDRVHLYSEMHRFIPAVAAATAGARIAEIPVRHHPRRFGESKYGLGRIWKVLADLLVIKMIRSFRERPLALFGIAAGVSAIFGAIMGFGSVVSLATLNRTTVEAFVFPSASLLWFGLAFYLLMVGLIGEVMLHEQRRLGEDSLPVARQLIP